jgi:hypothetical protein
MFFIGSLLTRTFLKNNAHRSIGLTPSALTCQPSTFRHLCVKALTETKPMKNKNGIIHVVVIGIFYQVSHKERFTMGG